MTPQNMYASLRPTAEAYGIPEDVFNAAADNTRDLGTVFAETPANTQGLDSLSGKFDAPGLNIG